MISQSIRAFVYGFVLFGGIVLIPELAFSSDIHNNPIWLVKFVIASASAGGAMFVFSWFCLFVLWKIVRDLMRKDTDV